MRSRKGISLRQDEEMMSALRGVDKEETSERKRAVVK